MVTVARHNKHTYDPYDGTFRGRSPSRANAEADRALRGGGGVFFLLCPKGVIVYTKDLDGAEADYGQDANMSPAESTWRSTQALYALS